MRGRPFPRQGISEPDVGLRSGGRGQRVLPHPCSNHTLPSGSPHPEARAVRVGPDEAEAIAGNILAPHCKSDDGGRVPGEEVLGAERTGRGSVRRGCPRALALRPSRRRSPSTLLSGLISQLSVSLSSWKPAWRRRLRHSATTTREELSHRQGTWWGHGPDPLCPGHLPW